MIFTIAGKELKSLFASPLAWIVLAALQVVTGYGFLKRLDDFLQIQSQLVQMANPPGVTELVAIPLFATIALVLLFAVPLLSMRLIAEESRNQTLTLLISAPVSITEIVVGKFLGLVTFLMLLITLFALMPLSLAAGTKLDFGLLAAAFGGLALLVSTYAAIGLYASSLTTHPVAAALGAFCITLAMVLMGETTADNLRSRGWEIPAALAQTFAPIKNFEPLGKGVVDTAAIACSILLMALFIVLTIRRLDARRLRG